MTIALLLATTADASGGPAALLPWDGGSALGALVSTARAAGCEEVVVLTRAAWAAAVRAQLGAPAGDDRAVARVGVVSAEDGAEERARTLEVLERAGDRGCGVALVHGHLIADEVSLLPLLDGQGGTAVLAAAVPRPPGPSQDPAAPTSAAAQRDLTGAAHRTDLHVAGMGHLRTLRGRVVAAASPDHALVSPTEHALGALAVHARAVADASRLLRALAGSLGGSGDAADGDVQAGLLVALVRGGVPVTARPPARAGVATLATTPEVARRASEQRAQVDHDRVLLQEAVKREDGFFTTFLVSSWSPLLVRAARHLGLRPDTVTWLSMALGVLAATAFAVGLTAWSALGAVLLYLAFVLDCVDGQLARTIRRFSARGAWLDAMFDRGKEYVVYGGLAVGAVRGGDEAGVWLLAGAALALQTMRHTLDLAYAAQQAADVERLVRRDLADPQDPGPSFWEVGHGGSGRSTGDGTAAGAGASAGSGAAAGPGAAVAGQASRASLPRRVILALRRAEGVAVLKWAKRIVVLPIGERFALIGVLAIVTTPRVLFLVLLVWGGLATLYTAGGRVVRSVA